MPVTVATVSGSLGAPLVIHHERLVINAVLLEALVARVRHPPQRFFPQRALLWNAQIHTTARQFPGQADVIAILGSKPKSECGSHPCRRAAAVAAAHVAPGRMNTGITSSLNEKRGGVLSARPRP